MSAGERRKQRPKLRDYFAERVMPIAFDFIDLSRRTARKEMQDSFDRYGIDCGS